jgi:hypothetical protein
MLIAWNVKLVSETAALRKVRKGKGIAYNRAIEELRGQLKAANENIDELRRELHDLKSGVGFERTATR